MNLHSTKRSSDTRKNEVRVWTFKGSWYNGRLVISYKTDDLFLHIFTNLRKGMLLKSVGEAEDNYEDEDDEDSKYGNKDEEKDAENCKL